MSKTSNKSKIEVLKSWIQHLTIIKTKTSKNFEDVSPKDRKEYFSYGSSKN